MCALPGRKVLLINAVHIKERLADLRPPYEGDTVEWPQGRMRKGTGWVGTCRMKLRGGGRAQAGLSCAARAAKAQQATARPAGDSMGPGTSAEAAAWTFCGGCEEAMRWLTSGRTLLTRLITSEQPATAYICTSTSSSTSSSSSDRANQL